MTTNIPSPTPTNDHQPTADPATKTDISVAQILGGALAAVTAAALGSRLGVAGTLVGAAIASVVAGVAGSLYTASLRHTHQKVKTAWTTRVGAGTQGRADDARGGVPSSARAPGDSGAGERSSRPARRPLPWLRMVAAAVAVFGLALVVLTGVELVLGSAISGGHGTTIEQASKPHKPSDKAHETKKDVATSSPSPSDQHTDDATPSSKQTVAGTATDHPSSPTPQAPITATTPPASTAATQPGNQAKPGGGGKAAGGSTSAPGTSSSSSSK